jgi:broad specificity phosphatase PhoE
VPVFFVSHPEVVVDPAVPITHWSLSATGRGRARQFAATGVLGGVTRILSSTETKAVETAAILADALGLSYDARPELCENDRTSTGYLPPAEFEATADEFFADPDVSVRGWERAHDAQRRIVTAVKTATRSQGGSLAVISHGGVGTLLLCDLLGVPVSRHHDQPRQGCWFEFDANAWVATSGWTPLPEP